MSRKQLIRRYNRMISTIDSADIYDGRGTFDLYTCNTCGNTTITTYKDLGVTPFTIPCAKCKSGIMAHVHTYSFVAEGTEVRNWIRPSLEQFLKLKPGLQEHVLNGGLILESDLK